ncbi:MAG: hypothetical protein KGO82_15165 [Bacteroidota bacterium]|nr:hypothetical protein [Bacteroidota bacterium]
MIKSQKGNAPNDDPRQGKYEDPIVNTEENNNVTNTEQELLRKAAGHPANAASEDRDKLALDETDDDGELLEEESIPDLGGEDLDIPGAELDDENEDIGEEDEENNSYSLPD